MYIFVVSKVKYISLILNPVSPISVLYSYLVIGDAEVIMFSLPVDILKILAYVYICFSNSFTALHEPNCLFFSS